ncbi:hypothetical protein A1O1_03626 [Capronia coronata CBS 617.96]|uniref:ADP-ribosylhydrolase ARH3 n=1 Tax=Capronia coronata CBS 617.96 TaxID=1182541 RepID=W9YDC3_9EURO|nr:uncharacterized protein A1O1_03626 [Capronia coronata CBS 617.96]EXJ90523.1 hypothetical protein A1O1_03626 [Capronia coronata CBS 617.96]
MPENPSLSSRVRGSFVGLAVCDALGGPVEFKKRGEFPKVTTMLPNESCGIGPGYFTDDTSMALCLAHSLVDCHGRSNLVDQVRRYIDWWKKGYMSSTGTSFGIGVSTASTLEQWSSELEARYNQLQADSMEAQEAVRAIQKNIRDAFLEEKFCGNGSLMRVLPAALVARSEPEAVELARESSLPTHPHLRCVHACMIYASLVYQALNGATKSELAVSLGETMNDASGNISDYPLEPALKQRLERYRTLGDWEATASEDIRSTGYVVDSLEASLWSFFKTDGFEDGAILAVNLGDDADTVGAIYGGLAGAFYGVDAIPDRWRQDLQRMDLVDEAVEKILAFRTHTV